MIALRWLTLDTSDNDEGVVTIDMATRIDPQVGVFTIDTGRLPAATLDLMDEVRDRYGVRLEVLFPDAAEVQHPPRVEPGQRIEQDHPRRDRRRAEEDTDRPQQHRQPGDRSAHPGREPPGMLHGQGHRQDLAEHRQEEDHPEDGHGEAGGAEDLASHGGGQRGGGDVHHRDAHQQGDE